MSDMRAKIALSGIIATIVMVVGLFSIAPIVSGMQADSVSTTGSSMGLAGHFTLTITDPDGFVKYYGQFDNSVQENTKECMIDIISASTLGGVCADATSIILGGDNTPGFNEDNGMQELYVGTNIFIVTPFSESRDAIGLNNAGSNYTQSFQFNNTDTTGTNPVGCIPDSNANGLQECTIREVGLKAAANLPGGLIARAGPAGPDPVAEPGDKIDAKYSIDLA